MNVAYMYYSGSHVDFPSKCLNDLEDWSKPLIDNSPSWIWWIIRPHTLRLICIVKEISLICSSLDTISIITQTLLEALQEQ